MNSNDINKKLDNWVVRTFSPLKKQMSYEGLCAIRKLALGWLILFIAIAVMDWFWLIVYVITHDMVMSPNGSSHVWFEIIACAISLMGYCPYIFLDRILLEEDIKRKK